MRGKIILAVVVVAAAVVGLAGIKAWQIHRLVTAGQTMTQPPETIASAIVHEEKWPDTLAAVGSISAREGVTMSPEIAGTVSEIDFESGASVNKGDLLVRLDTSSEEAQLRAVEAQVELARLNAERNRQLRTNNTVSQAEVDASDATLKQQQANADAIRATIAKKNIRAPFAGQLGIRLVNLGELLDVGKPIVSLQSLTPVFCDFSLPQQDLAQLKTGLAVRVAADTYPDQRFGGTLTAINPDLDQTTRSVRLQATLENAEKRLRPGMFVRVEVVLPQEQTVLAIPATAILRAAYGDSVYVIETNSTNAVQLVHQRFVHTGQARGDFISVESGLKAGDRVVKDGVFKLRNGMAVQENNEIAPQPAVAPKPSDS
ncbi:MAG TPA: efflux RND transporter periplasmic adaptor subunit [Candidatus Acidoferrum sp.]|nr:efflux RND transporter periplasmic adaptor subunit [Candidatus Acidoferrum sp.]